MVGVVYPQVTVRLATMVHRLGLADADDDTLRANIHRAVANHFETRTIPAWIDELFDAILAGRRTDSLVPCPGGYLDGVEGLVCVLGDLGSEAGTELRIGPDTQGQTSTWVLPRLNLVLWMTAGPGPSGYTLTSWVTHFPPLTVGLATILHRLGLAADDDNLRADVHEAVVDHLADQEPPPEIVAIVDAILHRRYTSHRMALPSHGTALSNILADLEKRFALAVEDDGEWWAWTLPAFDMYLWVTRESFGGDEYELRPIPRPR
jgi:hypothetical protein